MMVVVVVVVVFLSLVQTFVVNQNNSFALWSENNLTIISKSCLCTDLKCTDMQTLTMMATFVCVHQFVQLKQTPKTFLFDRGRLEHVAFLIESPVIQLYCH